MVVTGRERSKVAKKERKALSSFFCESTDISEFQDNPPARRGICKRGIQQRAVYGRAQEDAARRR